MSKLSSSNPFLPLLHTCKKKETDKIYFQLQNYHNESVIIIRKRGIDIMQQQPKVEIVLSLRILRNALNDNASKQRLFLFLNFLELLLSLYS